MKPCLLATRLKAGDKRISCRAGSASHRAPKVSTARNGCMGSRARMRMPPGHNSSRRSRRPVARHGGALERSDDLTLLVVRRESGLDRAYRIEVTREPSARPAPSTAILAATVPIPTAPYPTHRRAFWKRRNQRPSSYGRSREARSIGCAESSARGAASGSSRGHRHW
jgi:hypothetical protein